MKAMNNVYAILEKMEEKFTKKYPNSKEAINEIFAVWRELVKAKVEKN